MVPQASGRLSPSRNACSESERDSRCAKIQGRRLSDGVAIPLGSWGDHIAIDRLRQYGQRLWVVCCERVMQGLCVGQQGFPATVGRLQTQQPDGSGAIIDCGTIGVKAR